MSQIVTVFWNFKSSLKLLLRVQVSTLIYSTANSRFLSFFIASSVKHPPKLSTATNIYRYKSTGSELESDVTSSTIILQDGLNIEELPVLIKKVNANSLLQDNENVDSSGNVSAAPEDSTKIHILFQNCTCVGDVFTVLGRIPSGGLTPSIGVKALDRLLELREITGEESPTSSTSSPETSFTISAVVSQLCGIILTSDDSEVILDGLRSVVKYNLNKQERKRCLDSFVKVIHIRICDNNITLSDICEVVQLLVTCGSDYLSTIDHCWQGVVNQASDMDRDDILRVYSILPYFKNSQNVMLRTVAKATSRKILTFTSEDVSFILTVLTRVKFVPKSILYMLTKWINLNLHLISEKEFASMLSCLKELNHFDSSIEKAVERYMKIKGASCQLNDTVSTIASYCSHFRWRNEHVLNGMAEFYIANSKTVPLNLTTKIICVLGYLNFVPKNSFKFFEVLENVLNESFSDFQPEHVIDIMLSCVYLQRYPLNYVKKLFSPFFLDRMNVALEPVDLKRVHSKLKLLDCSLALECSQYNGPYLPRNLSAKSLKRDGRLSRLKNTLNEDMSIVLGGEENFKFSVVLPKVPLSEVYIVDYVICLDKTGNPLPANSGSNVEKRLSVLVNLPENTCLNGETSTGPYATRIRHLKILGYEVVQLEYESLQRFRPSSKERLKYLQSKILAPFVNL